MRATPCGWSVNPTAARRRLKTYWRCGLREAWAAQGVRPCRARGRVAVQLREEMNRAGRPVEEQPACGVEVDYPALPIRATMARRIGSGSVGQTSRTRAKSGSEGKPPETAPDFAAPSEGGFPKLLCPSGVADWSSDPLGVSRLGIPRLLQGRRANPCNPTLSFSPNGERPRLAAAPDRGEPQTTPGTLAGRGAGLVEAVARRSALHPGCRSLLGRGQEVYHTAPFGVDQFRREHAPGLAPLVPPLHSGLLARLLPRYPRQFGHRRRSAILEGSSRN